MKFKTATLATILLACVFASLACRASTIQETLDPFSHPGNYYGGIYFTFNVASDSSADTYAPGSVIWNMMLYDDSFQSGQQTVNLGLHIGTTGDPNEIQFAATETVLDPMMPINDAVTQGVLGSGQNQYKSVDLLSGITNSFVWTQNDAGTYHDFELGKNETVTYGLTVDFSFDGETAIGTGEWYVNYLTDNPIFIGIVPEPSSWALGALGALAVAFWKKTRSCR